MNDSLKVSLLVPFRSDSGRRDRLWEFVSAWLGTYHPDWEVLMGFSPKGPFNRGAAINRSAAASGADVFVIHDADNICDPATLRSAALTAHSRGGCVWPFSTYIYCDQPTSDRLIDTGNMFVAPDTDSSPTS